MNAPQSAHAAPAPLPAPLVDSHCHLDFFLKHNQPKIPNLPPLPQVLENAAAANISILLSIATSLPLQQNLLNLCATHENNSLHPRLFCSAGTHPTYLSEETPPPSTEKLLAWHNAHPERIIAFGESGLDFFRPTNPPAALQETSFRNHILAAQEAQIPLVVHNRAADPQLEDILIQTQKEKPYPCILHCFAASQRLASVALETGCLLSFAGLITYRSARNLEPIVHSTPLEALLLETDSPFLPPQEDSAARTKRPPYAEPAMLSVTARYIAALKSLSLGEVAEATTQNFLRTFKVASKEKNSRKDSV